MCGIAAIFNLTTNRDPINREELVRMRDHMISRGPDGFGLWVSPDQRVGFGHRRLSIIDLSDDAAQPMATTDGRYTIVYNGEIYNYQALRTKLQQAGIQFQSQSDTEVILKLFAAKGAEMLSELRGMYAFAIWDDTEKTLFLARDPYGIKPLYYANDGHTFRVASQVKALLAGGNLDTSPESAGHVGFFIWGHVPDPYTLYKSIRALPAGHYLTIKPSGETSLKCYCNIANLFCANGSEPAPSDSSAKGALREALVDTIQHHLIADVPVGLFLSSGLDSTTLVALAAEQKGEVRTVTLGFEEYRGTENDEVPLAKQVARRYGTKHKTVWITRKDFQEHFDRCLSAMDQPTLDGVNTYFVSWAARQAGLKVALSGLGGDELFGGYPSFREIPKLVRTLGPLRRVPRFGRILRGIAAPLLKHVTSPKYAGLLEYGSTYGGAYLLRRALFMPWEVKSLLDTEMIKEGCEKLSTLSSLNKTVGSALARAPVSELSAPGSPLQAPRSKPLSPLPYLPSPTHPRVSALESCWYMRNQLLRDADWASMAHTLEIRVPFVDTTLLKTLGPTLRSSKPPTKLDMAATPRSPLPAPVLNRPKTGFSIPVREWMSNKRTEQKDRGLRGWAKEVYERGARSVEQGVSELKA